MATTKELTKLIGRTGEITLEGFTVPVRITDAKVAYGGTRLEVTPIHGAGTKWVEERRVTLVNIEVLRTGSASAIVRAGG